MVPEGKKTNFPYIPSSNSARIQTHDLLVANLLP